MPEEVSPDAHFLANEISYRRSKAWSVFSWSATVVTALTAFAIGLETKTGQVRFELTVAHRIILSLSVICIAGFGWRWVQYTWKKQKLAKEIIKQYYSEEVGDYLGSPVWDWAYTLALILLALAGLAAVWWPIF